MSRPDAKRSQKGVARLSSDTAVSLKEMSTSIQTIDRSRIENPSSLYLCLYIVPITELTVSLKNSTESFGKSRDRKIMAVRCCYASMGKPWRVVRINADKWAVAITC